MPTLTEGHDSSQYDEFYTVVENTSGKEKTFGFIGKTLAADEVYAVRGDLVATLGAKRSPRDFEAMRRSTNRNSLKIHNRPMPILWDATAQRPVGLAVQGGLLGTVDPTYASESSANFDAI
jgi:hypothetical protein